MSTCIREEMDEAENDLHSGGTRKRIGMMGRTALDITLFYPQMPGLKTNVKALAL